MRCSRRSRSSREDVLGASITLARPWAHCRRAAALTNGYVRTLFDRYAGAFDAHLTRSAGIIRALRTDQRCARTGSRPGGALRHCLDLGMREPG